MKKILILFAVFASCSSCSECALIKQTKPALGTIVEITVADKDKSHELLYGAIEKAFSEIERIEGLFSRFRPESDISRINNYSSLKPIKVSPETIEVLEDSIKFSRLTDGAFDITICPLMEDWDFKRRKIKSLPQDAQLKESLDKVGWQNINIIKEKRVVSFGQPQMSLDLGGIAKGYAVDKAVEVLKQEGIDNALVNAGGDIYALGKCSKVNKWHIGLQHPRKRDAILTVLELENKAVATSGDYQKYIEINKTRYSHILNPESGWPASKNAISVTILADNCTSADALATSVFALGPEKGMSLVNRLENTEAIMAGFEEDKLCFWLSEGLRERVRLNQ
ncbi:MAG: FAD:protein FMN transferase [Candidatus Omnitrophota bacterium]|nr:MAG: FAD:protein FMN transferase [Candidatus Omnitrophota bacterium]